MNDQRKLIYEQRGEIIDSETVDDAMAGMRAETVNSILADACPPGSYPAQWDVEGMKARLANVLELSPPLGDWLHEDVLDAAINSGESGVGKVCGSGDILECDAWPYK